MLKYSMKYLIILIIILMINNSMCKDLKNLIRNKYNNDANSNSDNIVNNNNNDNNDDSKSTSSVFNNLSWDCANNSTCIQSIAKNLLNNYENGANIDFGLFSVEKLTTTKTNELKANNNDNDNNENNNNKQNNNNNDKNNEHKDTEGRSLSTIEKFIEGNAIKVPIGPMVFSIQRSDDNPDYMELALLKKSSNDNTEQARRGGGGFLKKRHGHKDKKHLQVYIPMYLAANAFGWTLLAVKAVGVLTIKALLVSKLAFLIAAGIVAKKMMDSAQQKMLFPHHHPYLMPYSMDYGLPAHSMPGAEEYLNLHLANHQALESMAAAETNHVAHALQANGTQQQQQQQQLLSAVPSINGNGNVPKIKRSDPWSNIPTSRSPSPLFNYFTKSSVSTPYVYQK